MSQPPVRVLFFIPALSGGGAERVLVTLLQRFDRSRIEAHLALADTSGPLTPEVPADVPVHDLKCGRARWAVFRLRGLLRSVKPRVCFSAFGYMNLLVMLAKPFLPGTVRFIGRETNIPSINNRETPFPKLLNFLYPRLYPRFDRIVCQSRDMQQDLVQSFRVPQDKTRLIHNPVDTERVQDMARAEPEIDLPGDAVTLLAAGKLKHQKGFDFLLQAFALLDDPRLHLTILGQGPERGALEVLARELGVADRVSLPGFVPNPYAIMARSDCFVLSSRFEGFPNVLLEAGACGLPVAAFQCPGGIDEIITPGENGFMAAPQEPEDLARAITQTLAAKQDGKFSPESIRSSTEERFGVAAIVRQYEDLILGVAAEE